MFICVFVCECVCARVCVCVCVCVLTGLRCWTHKRQAESGELAEHCALKATFGADRTIILLWSSGRIHFKALHSPVARRFIPVDPQTFSYKLILLLSSFFSDAITAWLASLS